MSTPSSYFNPKVYLDVSIDGGKPERITIELFRDIVPITSDNFLHLCLGTPGYGYTGSKFHRIIPRFMIQGGMPQDGSGGKSRFGQDFDDENFLLAHDRPFLLSMANSGVNTNGAQFFITTVPTPHLDGHHVVFGQVLDGKDLVKRIESFGSSQGTPSASIVIVGSGQL